MRCTIITAVALVAFSIVVHAQEEQKAEPGLTVEAQFCTSLEDRMPADEVVTVPPDIGQVYLWNRVSGSQDSTWVTHVWYYEGKEEASIDLPVIGSPWRTWSVKNILPTSTGTWEVKILDAKGNQLDALSFTVSEKAE